MPQISDDIFRIKKIDLADGQVIAALEVNGESEILKGHFPGQPVVPGACMLQVVKNVFELGLKSSFCLKKADHIKFMSMVIPKSNLQLQLTITFKLTGDESYIVQAKLSNEDLICFKFQGSFQRLSKF